MVKALRHPNLALTMIKNFLTYSTTVILLCLGLSLKAQVEDGKHEFRLIAHMKDGSLLASTSNEVSFTGRTTLYFPTAFSPDHDGHNDTFGAVGLNAQEYHLKIYNRWGELLFESKHIYDRWDGTFQGETVSEGVYVYQFTATEAQSGKSIEQKGTITVLL